MPFPVAMMRSPGGVLLSAPIRVGTFPMTTGSGTPVNGPFTPAANSRLFLLSQARRGSSLDIAAPTISDNVGNTWVPRGEAHNGGGTLRVRLSLHELAIGNSPVELNVTTNWGTVGAGGSTIIQVQGYAGAVTNVAVHNTNTAGDGSLTFGSTPAANSLVFAVMTATGATPWSGVPSGGDWDELYQWDFTVSPMQTQVAWDAENASTSAVWTSGNGVCAGLGWEIPVS